MLAGQVTTAHPVLPTDGLRPAPFTVGMRRSVHDTMTAMDRMAGSGRLPDRGLEGGGEGAPDRERARKAVPRAGVVILVALCAVVVSSLGLHLWGIVGDLPYPPDVDEPDFTGVITNSAMTQRSLHASRYPGEHALYRSLEAAGRLLVSFQPGEDRSGPLISIYEIAGS